MSHRKIVLPQQLVRWESVSEHIWERQSVNTFQMDIKCKNMWYSNLGEKHLFLDISSTNTDTLVPLLYRCVKIRSIDRSLLAVVSATSTPLSQPLHHQQNSSHFLTHLWAALHDKHFPSKTGKHFFMNILCTESFCPQKKNAQQNAVLQ
jgi:hypothetical protein